MKKVIKASFVGFQDRDLSMGLADLEFSEEHIKRMRAILASDKLNVEQDVVKELDRIGQILKEEYKGLGKPEDYVRWFFNKKKFWQSGDKLPKMSDDELREFTELYVADFRAKCKSTKENNSKAIPTKAKWLLSKSQLELLGYTLVEKGFINENEQSDFISLLSGDDFKSKINWLGATTLLIYLFDELEKANFIDSTMTSNKNIEGSFLSNGKYIKNIKQTKSNIKNNQNRKPNNSDLVDQIIGSLKVTLPH